MPTDTMAPRDVEQELITLETQYWQAIQNTDAETALRLTDDPCVLIGAQGVTPVNRKSFKSDMESAPYSLESFDLDEIQVRLLKPDVAIVVYKVWEELTVEGKPVALEAAESSTWLRKNGSWVCALHSESLIGDPFGRDRRPGK